MGHWIGNYLNYSNYSQMVQKEWGRLFVLFLQLFYKFGIISKEKKNPHPRGLVTWMTYEDGFCGAFSWVPWRSPAGNMLVLPPAHSPQLLPQLLGFDQPIPLGPGHPTIPGQMTPGQLPLYRLHIWCLRNLLLTDIFDPTMHSTSSQTPLDTCKGG